MMGTATFLEVISEFCGTDQITLSSTMDDLDKASGDETSQLMSEITQRVLGISALDYDEHPVLENAWHTMQPWNWTHVQQFYDYVADTIAQHEG